MEQTWQRSGGRMSLPGWKMWEVVRRRDLNMSLFLSIGSLSIDGFFCQFGPRFPFQKSLIYGESVLLIKTAEIEWNDRTRRQDDGRNDSKESHLSSANHPARLTDLMSLLPFIESDPVLWEIVYLLIFSEDILHVSRSNPISSSSAF